MPDDYESDTPISKHLQISWLDIPLRPMLKHFEIQRTILTREDNLLMAVEGATGKEDTFFEVKEILQS